MVLGRNTLVCGDLGQQLIVCREIGSVKQQSVKEKGQEMHQYVRTLGESGLCVQPLMSKVFLSTYPPLGVNFNPIWPHLPKITQLCPPCYLEETTI